MDQSLRRCTNSTPGRNSHEFNQRVSKVTIVARSLFAASGELNRINVSSSSRRPLKLRVLLVEDDEGDAYLIRRALAKNPWVGEVVLAEDGVEALDLIDRGAVRPDLAIVDLNIMPRKDGLTLLKDFAIRDSVRFPSIVLTSSKSGADALRSTKRGKRSLF